MNKVDERKKRQLLELYPNGKVEGLRQHNSLYQMIFATSKNRKMTVKEYVEGLGFEYLDRRLTEVDEIKEELLKLYPDHVVSKLTIASTNLYSRISIYANKNNISVYDFLESMGFEYVDGRYSDELKNIEELLLQMYPDRKISGLQKKHNIYIKILRLANKENQTVEEYLNDIGFEYLTSKRKNRVLLDEKITDELLKMYPDRRVKSVSKNNLSLYKKLQLNSLKRKKTLVEYLNDLGFTYDVSRSLSGKRVVKNKSNNHVESGV